jgi:hypothetical protein
VCGTYSTVADRSHSRSTASRWYSFSLAWYRTVIYTELGSEALSGGICMTSFAMKFYLFA